MVLPSRGVRVRAVASGLRADGQEDRLAALHALDLPLQDAQLGRVHLVSVRDAVPAAVVRLAPAAGDEIARADRGDLLAALLAVEGMERREAPRG